MSTLASTLLLFLNHTHISKKGTASECRGSAGVFRWGTLALALLCVPRLQQAWGAFARGDSLELNIVVNGIQQIAEGPQKLPVLQASRSCDHGPDTIRAGAMSARRSDARLPRARQAGPPHRTVLAWGAYVERPSVGAGRAGIPQKALGKVAYSSNRVWSEQPHRLRDAHHNPGPHPALC